jgi:ATP-dependent DNA helicase RecQ
MVYFLATRLLRDRRAGPTLIVSPLLALMRNQLAAAQNLGLDAVTINTTNRDDWQAIMARVIDDQVDLILISPERLANEDFMQNCLLPIAARIELLVIDEAHCISDWGHDFRPDYQRVDRILGQLPPNVSVLATTATANDRVVGDVLHQLGPATQLQRGDLARSSLRLSTTDIPDRAARLAWLIQALRVMPGSGIIYTLTKRDANRVAQWLQSQGVEALAYHGSITGDDEGTGGPGREELEEMLLTNQVKALVATNALGMGFDKPDLGFVIHFQSPQSVVHYYQQVGRAGRGIAEAYGVLLGGEEDSEINDFFINQAFPPEWQVSRVLDALEDAEDGLSVPDLTHLINLRQSQIEKVLKILGVANSALVVKQGSRWYRTVNAYADDSERVRRLTQQREAEWVEMQNYAETDACLMRYLAEALDDPNAEDCGRCSNCVDLPLLDIVPDARLVATAQRFIRRSEVVLRPRAQWQAGAFPIYGWRGNIRADLRCEEGRALAIWRDAGWGTMIEEDKEAGRFRDDLVDACVEMVGRWTPASAPTWVTCVPSLRSARLVPDFSSRLAARLGLPFCPAVAKISETQRQRAMMNSWQQSNNLDGAFALVDGQVRPGPVLLIDDVVDSRWSMTVIGALLRQGGSGPVLPLALASTSGE